MADFSLGDAELTTSVNLDGLQSGLNEAEGIASSGGTRAGSALSGAMAAGVAAGAAAVVAAVGIAISQAVSYASEQAQAINTLQAQLGVTADEAQNLGDVAEQVFLNNFGESIGEATEAVGQVRQQLGELPPNELQAVTEGAFAIRDAFGVEVPESINTVRTLMDNFGLSSEQALDFVTKGFQEGLNSSDDFLDTVNEYATQFGNGGASADQFFSLLQSGLQGGVLGTDKAADAFKEFGLRIADGSSSSRDALAGLGINADELWAKMAAGDVTTADAFEQVIAGLNGIEDPVLRNQLGVALLGTQYEDLGADAVMALSLAGTSMADMAGATDSLNVQYGSLGAVVETINRQFLVTISPIGEALLALANAVMPYVLAGFENLRAGIEIAITFIGNIIQTVIGIVSGLFTGEGSAATTAWGQTFANVQTLINTVMTNIQSVVGLVLGALTQFWNTHGAEIQAFAATTWNQIQSIITTVAQIIGTIVSELTQRVNQYFGEIATFLTTHSDTIQTVLGLAWTFIQTTIGTALANIQSVVNIALALLQGDFDTVWTEIQNIVDRTINAAKTIVDSVLGTIKQLWADNSDAIKKKAEEVWEGVKTAISTAVEGAKTAATEQIDGILSYIDGLAQRAIDAGTAFIDNIKEGVMGAIDKLIEDAKAGLEGLTDLLPGSEPKDPTSPLRGLAERGRAIITNMTPGMQDGFSELDSAMRTGLSATADIVTSATTYNLTAQYSHQPERRLRDDVRMLQLMSS